MFTSGGTEADNLALFGIAQNGHAITTTSGASGSARRQRAVASVTKFAVDGRGVVDPDAIRRALRPDTKIISVMHANNELGVIQPIAEIAKIAREAGVILHSDGVQAAGKIPVDVHATGRRFVFDQRAQVLRAQGRGRAVCPQGNRARRRCCTAGIMSATGARARKTFREPWDWGARRNGL